MMKDRLKVAIVNASDFGGGAERSVLSLHRCLLEKGHDSTLYVGYKNTDTPNVVQIPYVRGLFGIRRLARWLESRTGWQDIYNPSFRNLKNLIPPDTDVIHFNNLWGSSGYADLSVLPALTRRIPGVITERQNWLMTGHCAYFHECERWKTQCSDCPDLNIAPCIPKDGSRFNWKRKQRLVRKSNLVLVAISDWLKRQAEQSPIWKGKKIVRIYNGIDLKVFKPAGVEQRLRLRKEFGISDDKVAVLMTGQTINEFKGGRAMHGFVAVNRLKEQSVIPVLVGKLSSEAQKFIEGPSIAIPFRKTPEEMAQCYQAADITLATSVVEAFGRIPAESQACGTPVVSFDTGGLAEVVKDHVGGLSVARMETEGLVSALKRMISDRSLRHSLGCRGVEYVAEHFEDKKIAELYIDLFRERAGLK